MSLSSVDRATYLRKLAYAEHQELTRFNWVDDAGRPCLLAAYAPEARVAKNWTGCPAAMMWPWLARVTPGMDDHGSEEAWPVMVRRYADAVLALARINAWANKDLSAKVQRAVFDRLLNELVKPVLLHEEDIALLECNDNAVLNSAVTAINDEKNRKWATFYNLGAGYRRSSEPGWWLGHEEHTVATAATVRYTAVAAMQARLHLHYECFGHVVSCLSYVTQELENTGHWDRVNNIILDELEAGAQ